MAGWRTGLVWPDDVSTLDDLCSRERAAAGKPLPSGNPDKALAELMERLGLELNRGAGSVREVRREFAAFRRAHGL